MIIEGVEVPINLFSGTAFRSLYRTHIQVLLETGLAITFLPKPTQAFRTKASEFRKLPNEYNPKFIS